MAEPSYFSDFLDLADNKNINSIPDAYASIGAFANLPAEQVAIHQDLLEMGNKD